VIGPAIMVSRTPLWLSTGLSMTSLLAAYLIYLGISVSFLAFFGAKIGHLFEKKIKISYEIVIKCYGMHGPEMMLGRRDKWSGKDEIWRQAVNELPIGCTSSGWMGWRMATYVAPPAVVSM